MPGIGPVSWSVSCPCSLADAPPLVLCSRPTIRPSVPSSNPGARQGDCVAKAGRCLIADDMGLGKTVQSIAAVEILAQTAGKGAARDR